MTNPEELYRRHSASFDKLLASEKEDELVEKMALAMRDAYIKEYDDPPYNTQTHYPLTAFTAEARAALAAARPVIRAEALEEAARVADEYQHPNMALYPQTKGIASAIRALISNPRA